jgi:hypothetical protein
MKILRLFEFGKEELQNIKQPHKRSERLEKLLLLAYSKRTEFGTTSSDVRSAQPESLHAPFRIPGPKERSNGLRIEQFQRRA